MPTDVIMPQMGESIVEGTITKWLKKPGDKVQRDEPLFEISTDKVDAEIPAPASGVLQEIKVEEGATVQVNTVVGTIAADGEAAAPAKAAATAPAAAPKKAAPAPASAPPPAKPGPAPVQQESDNQDDHARSSPLVRKIARENNVDLHRFPAPVWAAALPSRTSRHSWNAAPPPLPRHLQDPQPLPRPQPRAPHRPPFLAISSP